MRFCCWGWETPGVLSNIADPGVTSECACYTKRAHPLAVYRTSTDVEFVSACAWLQGERVGERGPDREGKDRGEMRWRRRVLVRRRNIKLKPVNKSLVALRALMRVAVSVRISAEDFSNLFDVVELCSVNPDSYDEESTPASWAITEHEGCWLPGSSAGGSRKYNSTVQIWITVHSSFTGILSVARCCCLCFFPQKHSGKIPSIRWSSKRRTRMRMRTMTTTWGTMARMAMMKWKIRLWPQIRRREPRSRSRKSNVARCWWSCCRKTEGRGINSTSCTSPFTSIRCYIYPALTFQHLNSFSWHTHVTHSLFFPGSFWGEYLPIINNLYKIKLTWELFSFLSNCFFFFT